MTVKELIEKLEAVENKDLIVVMSYDEEGNGFMPLHEFTIGCTEYLDGRGDFTDRQEDMDGEPNALCLWPC